MSDKKHNGWTNYATWRVNIEIKDGYDWYEHEHVDAEYVKELATHHVGGYLKIAPEHTEEGPLNNMMKPGMGSYNTFKEMFEHYSKLAGKKQYLIPYFISAHPGTTDRDMVNLALWLKANDFIGRFKAVFTIPIDSITVILLELSTTIKNT